MDQQQEDLVVSPQLTTINPTVSSSKSRKHRLDHNHNSTRTNASGSKASLRSNSAKKQRLDDIAVQDGDISDEDGLPEDEGGVEGLDDDDDEDDDDDYLAPHSDSDEFVDPSLLPPSRRARLQSSHLPSTSTSSISQSISRFLPMTTTTASAIAAASAAAGEVGHDPNMDINLVAIDYTHISQVLSHHPMATNASPQTLDLMTKVNGPVLGVGTLEERLQAFMDEVRTNMLTLSQRVDSVETARFTSAATISSLQQSVRTLNEHTRAATSHLTSNSTDADSLLPLLDPDPLAGLHPASDAANAHGAEQIGAILRDQIRDIEKQSASSANKAAIAPTGAGSFAYYMNNPTASGKDDYDTNPSASAWATTAAATATTSKRGRKSTSAPKSMRADTPGIDVKPGKRARKPELSRVVRSTMFRLLGLSLSSNPAKFHGYASSPDLPEFTTNVTFDSTTGARLWRWEWDKTIRQSQYNASFSTAIQNQVNTERNQGSHKDVPEEDWDALEDAIESAYTNMRRERDAQIDPKKKEKKDEHRKRGKKRGLKEEKCKRRQKAFNESKGLDGVGTSSLLSSWLSIGSTSTSMDPTLTDDTSFDSFQNALEIKYMSSEDEVDTNDPVTLSTLVLDAEEPITNTIPTSRLMPGEKTFELHRPVWRSVRLSQAFHELDKIKPPERAYRRIVGEPRNLYPPPQTPGWMISAEWGVAHPESDRPTLDRKGKGKAK